MNSFLLITPFRNASRFIAHSAASSLKQLYRDFRIVFIDDASTDSSLSVLRRTIEEQSSSLCREIHINANPHPQGALANTHRAILEYARDDDIIAIVDGDDWLLHEDVLTIVNAFYESTDCWVSYGDAVWKPEDRKTFETGPYRSDEIDNLRIPRNEYFAGLLRRWRVQHLRTFRAKLYRAIAAFDPEWSCLKDDHGRFWNFAADVAVMLPLIEMAGAERIHVSTAKLYVYNQHEQNDHVANRPDQADATRRIFALPAFPRLAALDEQLTTRSAAPSFARPARATVGQGIHLSGWPSVRRHLEQIRTSHPVILDDFVEQTFCYDAPPRPYQRPWVGIFHHPPHLPDFAFRAHRPDMMLQMRAWQQSARWLIGGIALSEYHAAYLRNALKIPVIAAKHPACEPAMKWNPSVWQMAPRRLLQIGFYARNTRAIYQVPPIEGYERARLLASHAWITGYDAEVQRYWASAGHRPEFDGVIEAGHVAADQYEQFLASSVVLMEVFDASANNVVVECLIRNTPLAVNRHPAIAEYLGVDYPLFFDDLMELPDLLQEHNVLAAHEHLCQTDKSDLSEQAFRTKVEAAIDAFFRGENLNGSDLQWASRVVAGASR